MAKQDYLAWTLYGISPYASRSQFIEQMEKERLEEENTGVAAPNTVASGSKA